MATRTEKNDSSDIEDLKAERRTRRADSPISLEGFLPALVNRLAAQLVAAFTREIEKYGISVPEWRVLVALDERSPLRLTELADKTSIELSTLSRLIRRLDQRGLCRVDPYGRDQRAGTIELHSSGKQLLSKLLPIGKEYEAALVAGMSSKDIEFCRQALRRFHANLAAYLIDRSSTSSMKDTASGRRRRS